MIGLWKPLQERSLGKLDSFWPCRISFHLHHIAQLEQEHDLCDLKFLVGLLNCEALLKLCSVLSVHLTSSKSLVGVAGVVADIQKEKKVFSL